MGDYYLTTNTETYAPHN